MSGAAGRKAQRRAQLPLLDRLIDEAPEQEADPPLTAADHLALLRRAVRRDVEMLLNARPRWQSVPAAFGALKTSPLTYGVPDFGAGTFHDRRAREALRLAVEDSLRRFEPRFLRVSVYLTDERSDLDRTLRLKIDALLHADPAPEPIALDTVVDVATASVRVRPGTGG